MTKRELLEWLHVCDEMGVKIIAGPKPGFTGSVQVTESNIDELVASEG